MSSSLSAKPGADRVHYVNETDIRTVLGRLPGELWHRLRVVHFNDRSRGGRIFGYVTHRGRQRDHSECAFPPRMTLGRALLRGQRPEVYGALPGRKWPQLAVRRLMLYHVFLHEIGHSGLHRRAREVGEQAQVRTGEAGGGVRNRVGALDSGPNTSITRMRFTIPQAPRRLQLLAMLLTQPPQ